MGNNTGFIVFDSLKELVQKSQMFVNSTTLVQFLIH